MRHTRNYRPPFDPAPTSAFVYGRPLRIGGVQVSAGDPVDREAVDERRLRQMYEARLVAYAAGSAPAPPPVRPLAVGPTDLLHPSEARPPEKERKRGIARRAA